jgi:HD superfamily phosphohydrolase YqeK
MLHDISKEYSVAEQFDMMKKSNCSLTDTDLMSEPVFHSFTAPVVIKSEFAAFATDNVLSAVFNHTTGAPDMSLFDEIIFVADYIEQGRKYEHCKLVRKTLYDAFSASKDREECVMHLHNATIMALEHTIINLINNKKVLNERTVASRNAFLARVPAPLVF